MDIGLPLRNMHTYNEVLCMKDCETLCSLVKEFIRSADIASEFRKEELF